MKEQQPGSSEKEYRQRRIAAQKLSEELDKISSLDQSLHTEQSGSVIKNAIIDWGRRKP